MGYTSTPKNRRQADWSNVRAILFADLCDSTKIKADAKGPLGKLRAAGINQLHNEIVRKQVEENGYVLKELGDEVISVFHNERDCLRSAVRIQSAFNLHNLLFSSHRLRTKVAVVFTNKDELFRADSHALHPTEDGKGCTIVDFQSEAMDRGARILGLARADEILISEEVTQYLNKYEDDGWYQLLEKQEPGRIQSLRGIGEVRIGKLHWCQFPRSVHSSLNLEPASEAVAAFPFSKIEDFLKSRQWRVESAVPTALRDAPIHLDLDFDFKKDITDILVVGQSLIGWATMLGTTSTEFREKGIKVGVLKMRPKACKELIKTTPHVRDVIKHIEESEGWFDLALELLGDALVRKYAHGLVQETWGFFTHKADDLFKASKNENCIGYGDTPPRLPYERIAETYFSSIDERDAWNEKVKQICEKYDGNLPVEWCVHEIMFGADSNEAVSLVFTMDWLNAMGNSQPGTNLMQYLLARKRCQHQFSNARRYP